MIDRLLSTIAPHTCCSCGQDFGILCENCISDIVEEPFALCVSCLKPSGQTNICRGCTTKWGVHGAWVVGERRGALRELLDRYKFDRAKAAVPVISRILAERVPQLPAGTCVSYIPDIPFHRRQRGYDHMKLIAESFAARRQMSMGPPLVRQTNVSQRQLPRKERLKAQNGAFRVEGVMQSPVILIDDICTTGSTLRAGIAALQEADAPGIFIAIIARQPLDSHGDL